MASNEQPGVFDDDDELYLQEDFDPVDPVRVGLAGLRDGEPFWVLEEDWLGVFGKDCI